MSPKCYACGGSGKITCQKCKGTGTMGKGGGAGDKKKPTTCPGCRGTGELTCHVCGGGGRR